MIQTRFKLVLAWFKRDEGRITWNWNLIISDSIVIESDSEPRGELLLIQNCSKWFKIDSERNQHDSNLF